MSFGKYDFYYINNYKVFLDLGFMKNGSVFGKGVLYDDGVIRVRGDSRFGYDAVVYGNSVYFNEEIFKGVIEQEPNAMKSIMQQLPTGVDAGELEKVLLRIKIKQLEKS